MQSNVRNDHAPRWATCLSMTWHPQADFIQTAHFKGPEDRACTCSRLCIRVAGPLQMYVAAAMAVRNCARTQEGQCTRYLQCKHVQADKISADAKALYTHMLLCRFFGGGGFPGFGGFGGMGDEEEQTPKGHDVHVELEVTLKDLYLGHQYKAWFS